MFTLSVCSSNVRVSTYCTYCIVRVLLLARHIREETCDATRDTLLRIRRRCCSSCTTTRRTRCRHSRAAPVRSAISSARSSASSLCALFHSFHYSSFNNTPLAHWPSLRFADWYCTVLYCTGALHCTALVASAGEHADRHRRESGSRARRETGVHSDCTVVLSYWTPTAANYNFTYWSFSSIIHYYKHRTASYPLLIILKISIHCIVSYPNCTVSIFFVAIRGTRRLYE